MKLAKTTDGQNVSSYSLNGGARDINKLFDSLVKVNPDRYSVYYRAVKAGWIEPFKNPYFVKNPSVVELPLFPSYNPLHPQLLRTMQNNEIPEFEVDWDQLERTPEVLDYQETSFEFSFDSLSEPNTDDYYELANFSVPPNRVGIVRDIQTALTWWDGVEPAFLRGDPNTNTNSDNFTNFGPLGEWFLRIESLSNNVDLTNNRVIKKLPGNAFNKLPTWRMMRFLWGHTHPVYWIIPENSVLSLWCHKYEITPGARQDWRQMAGLLAGATQPERSKQTFRNVTRAW